MSDIKAIILTQNSLEAIGLRNILCEHFNINAHITDIKFIESFKASMEPDMFFVDIINLVNNMSFFLPRKSKTIVIADNNVAIDDMKAINSMMPESHIIELLDELLAHDESKETDTSSALSQREIEVLRLIASGCINKEIAQQLNISINTVLSHRKNITSKLGIKSVSGLSFYAMMNGIV